MEITFARGKDVTGATDRLVKAFEAKQPYIKVKFREMPAEFAQAGYLEPLDNFIKADNINLKDYIQGAVDAAKL